MDIKKYIYGHCVNPVRVRVFDPITNSDVFRDVPCGKCLHCRNTAINEWVTRLYAESMYRPYVYYITLDYAPFSLSPSSFPNPVAARLAAETAACWNNLNITHNFGMQPILLRKKHLQDYFKRLRKNTNVKFSYFACGEYGMHANGRGFGRPHFHIIVFSDVAITADDFSRAWSIDGYQIGRVDFNDLRLNGSFDDIHSHNKLSSKYVFKYVCKYLQKTAFDFEKLSTIDFHRAYFKALCTNSLFPETEDVSFEQANKAWQQYCKDFAPFVVCSRRPSIGLAYFQENCKRFTKQDFRLFGLSKECVAFPRYYLRKTKELLCPFQTIGRDSNVPSSNARLAVVLSVLNSLYRDRLDFAHFGDSLSPHWNISRGILPRRDDKDPFVTIFRDGKLEVPLSDLHLYDSENRVFYQFNGYDYTLWRRIRKLGFVRVGRADILDILNRVAPVYYNYYKNFLEPMNYIRVLNEKELLDNIDTLYNGDTFDDKLDEFHRDVYESYQVELETIYKRGLLTQNSKISL